MLQNEIPTKLIVYAVAALVFVLVVGGYFATRCITEKINEGGTDVKIQTIPIPDKREFDARKLPERRNP